MPPSIESAACCISLPRMETILTPSASETTPAAASAVYSPSEKPAAALKVTPASASAAQARHRVGENRDLAVFRAGERRLVAVKAELRDVQPRAVAGLLKNQLGRLRIFVQILAHARGLRALAGEESKTVFHVRSSKKYRQTSQSTSEKVDNFASFYYNSQGILCQSNYCRFSTLFGRAI